MQRNAGPVPARTTVERRCLSKIGFKTFLRAHGIGGLAYSEGNREVRQVLAEVMHAAPTCMLGEVGVIAATVQLNYTHSYSYDCVLTSRCISRNAATLPIAWPITMVN